MAKNDGHYIVTWEEPRTRTTFALVSALSAEAINMAELKRYAGFHNIRIFRIEKEVKVDKILVELSNG